MRPNRKPRKRLRTAFTVFTMLFVASYVAQWWYCLSIRSTGPITRVAIDHGRLYCFGNSTHPIWPLGLQWDIFHYDLDGIVDPRPGQLFDWHQYVVPYWSWSIALWPLVALLILANAFWYWRDWRKRLRPGHCPNCNYDLRATPDRCPECGQAANVMSSEVRRAKVSK